MNLYSIPQQTETGTETEDETGTEDLREEETETQREAVVVVVAKEGTGVTGKEHLGLVMNQAHQEYQEVGDIFNISHNPL